MIRKRIQKLLLFLLNIFEDSISSISPRFRKSAVVNLLEAGGITRINFDLENQDSGELKKPSSSNSTTKTQTQTYFYFYVIENNPTVHGRVYGL